MFKWLLENSLANRVLVLIAGAVLMGYGAFTLTRTPVDVFPDRRLLVSLWPKLLRSYALEALGHNSQQTAMSRSQVADFLSDAATASWSYADTPGRGELFSMHQGGLDGQALEQPEGLAHLQILGWHSRRRPSRVDPSPWPPAIDLVKPRRGHD